MANSESKKDNFTPLYLMIILVLLILALLPYTLNQIRPKSSLADISGAASALFSGLAFAGVIFTIILQRKELILQRSELSSTRDEFITQNETLHRQRFENTFFQMINLHHEIVKNIEVKRYGKIKSGREVFSGFLNEMTSDLDRFFVDYVSFDKNLSPGNLNFTTVAMPKEVDMNKLKEKLEKDYIETFREEYQNALGHYFRNLYHIFKFIYLSKLITAQEKKFYATITRAQLSEIELQLLVFNALVSGYGFPNFTFLMKEYDIVQNVNWDNSPLNNYIKIIYNSELSEVHNPFLN